MTDSKEQTPTLILSHKEKRDIVLRTWVLPIGIMLVLIIVSVFSYNLNVKDLKKAKIKNEELKTDLQKVISKLNQVSVEEREIIAKSQKFLDLEKRGVSKSLNQLDIQEFLYSKAKFYGIGEFEYGFSDKGNTRQSLKSAIGIVEERRDNKSVQPNLSVSVLPQTMKFLVQHEVQFFNFLNAISAVDGSGNKRKKPASALARLTNCSIERVNTNGNLSPTKSNFKAECSLQWLSFIKNS